MNFYVGNQLKYGNHAHLEVGIGPQAETIEGLVRKIFAALGLTDLSLIENFNIFLGYDFFRNVVNKASVDPTAKKAIKESNGRRVKVPIDVYPEVVEDLKRFGINLLIDGKGKVSFGGYNPNFENNVEGLKKSQNNQVAPSQTPVDKMTTTEKVAETIRRAILLLPGDVGKELMTLLDPKVLGFVVLVIVVWVGLHFVVAGEILDVIVIIVGVVTIGPLAYVAAEHLVYFATKAVGAKNSEDLDESAKHLSEAIAILGVQVVMTLLLKKAPKTFRNPRVRMNQSKPSTPLTMKTVGEPPTTPGSIFYKPKLKEIKSDFPAGRSAGMTNQWGDIQLLVARNIDDVNATRIHELVHRFLVPKLQVFPKFRQFSAVLKNQSYLRSNILRYLEEALAETVAQLTVYGVNWRNFMVGVRFPVGQAGESCYVTKAALATEAGGVLLGPINIGGMIFRVYYMGQK